MNLNAVNRSVTLLSRLFDPDKSTQAFLQPTKGKPVFSENPKQELPRCKPESAGISSAALAAFLRQLHSNPQLRMHAVTVLRHGTIVCEAAFGAQDVRIPKYTFSACKSIVSLCIGILVGDGVLSVEDKIVDLFPDRVTAMTKMRLGSLCVRDLLTMRSGIVFNEIECHTNEDWVKCFLGSAVSGEIGTTFSYNSLNTYLLSAIVCRKSGMTLSQFAEKRLFGVLGITDFFWETCPAGIEKGGWGLYLRQEDMAKLGLLVLHGGAWKTDGPNPTEIPIIDTAYIKDAVTAQVEAPAEYGDYDYGYQIWVGRKGKPHMWLFNGMLGQNVLIFPDTDVVVVSNAGNDELFQQSPYYAITAEFFGTPTSHAILAENSIPDIQSVKVQKAYQDFCLACLQIREHTEEELHAAETKAKIASSAPAPTPTAKAAADKQESSEKEAEPKAFLSQITSLFHHHPNPEMQKSDTAEKMQEVRQPVRLPDTAAPFLDQTFCVPTPTPTPPSSPNAADTAAPSPSDAAIFKEISNSSAASIGLLPLILQAIQNAYTKGFVSLSFTKIVSDGDEQLLVTYREQEDTHVFSAGITKSVRSTCSFCGIPFRIAAACRFTTDEDERPVCILRIDFLETPCSRVIKLFLNPVPHAPDTPDAVLRQEETPGTNLIAQALINQKDQLSEQPVIGGAMEMIDNAYLSYKVKRTLAPEIGLIRKNQT